MKSYTRHMTQSEDRNRRIKLPAAVALTLTILYGVAAPASAGASAALTEALADGKLTLDMRYRFEHVTQDNPLRDANASTLRTVLGYQTGGFHGLSARLEFNNTAVIGSERYNSGPTGNQLSQYSVVADPKTTRVNQAYLDYQGVPDTLIRAGNQRIVLDNARFIGNVGFRQQEQTYEGLRIVNEGLPHTTINYAYVQRVNRIFLDANDTDVEHHFINANFTGFGFGTFTGYGYFLDYRESAPTSSTATMGARLDGAHPLADSNRLLYVLEYARQEDHGSFPGSYSADYHLIELGASLFGVTVMAGHEVLGSDEAAGKAFETRLATLHAHNGWADQFLATPAAGLQDTSLLVSANVTGMLLAAVYHDFRADQGNTRYGTEWGLRARKAFGPNYALEAKLASYKARDFSVDTDKLWLTAELRF